MPKRTHQPNVSKRKRRHGFMARNSSASGVSLLKRRRSKGRSKLTA